LQTARILKSVLNLGLADQFIEHGDPAKLMAMQGLNAAGIEKSIRSFEAPKMDLASGLHESLV
jgi:1-deoxy-D-xylulose-5-phosphate synthase